MVNSYCFTKQFTQGRRIDTLGRPGGEAFAIMLTGCGLRCGDRIAEDCRVRISSIDPCPAGTGSWCQQL